MVGSTTKKFRVFSTRGLPVVGGLREELAFEGRTVEVQEDGSVLVSGQEVTLQKLTPFVTKYTGGYSIESYSPTP